MLTRGIRWCLWNSRIHSGCKVINQNVATIARTCTFSSIFWHRLLSTRHFSEIQRWMRVWHAKALLRAKFHRRGARGSGPSRAKPREKVHIRRTKKIIWRAYTLRIALKISRHVSKHARHIYPSFPVKKVQRIRSTRRNT